jgi:hypothetical protein
LLGLAAGINFFTVGEEIDGDNYILLDRQGSCFSPTKENQQSRVFYGITVPLIDFDLTEQRRRHMDAATEY